MYKFDYEEIIKHSLHQIEFSIIDTCNRNCKSCSHFAPLAKQDNEISASDFVKQIEILHSLIPDVHTFWLTGGEPTSHPEYLVLLEKLRKIYKNIPIGVMSNGYGIHVRKNDRNFWDFIRENQIVWRITTYEVNPDYYIKIFEQNGCANLLSLDNNNYFTKLAVLSEEVQPVTQEKYNLCGWERLNIFVRNGKIWKCPTCEYIDLFNNYFNKKFEISADDYLNIDEKLTREQVIEFKEKPSNFCKNCDLSKRARTLFTVVKSGKNISEWLANDLIFIS